MRSDPAGATEAVAALSDQTRRALYEFVRDARRPVTRDECADGTGVSRKLAAFHLDKLLDRGLLRASFARPAGRSGPGAGRPAKRYELSDVEWTVSLPDRRYDLAGSILAEAVSRCPAGASPAKTALAVARERGQKLGTQWAAVARPRRRGPGRALDALAKLLESLGYAPGREGRELTLFNCPFHALVEVDRELVCGLNRELLAGVVEGIGEGPMDVRLDPHDGRCCVVVRRD
jgi:predicted ArsR family transcriptional regulator